LRIIVKLISCFSFEKYLRNAHREVLVSVTSEENIGAKSDATKELRASGIDFAWCECLERNSILGVM